MKELLKKHKVCMIMRNLPDEILVDFVRALYKGGIRLFEVTMNTKNVESQIKMLKKEFGEDIMVGAGTVLNRDMATKAKSYGAEFFVTPGVNRDVLLYCQENKMPILPGVYTGSEVSACLEYGIDTVKLFPARDLPKQYISDLKGPFDAVEFIAVGGVSLENMKDYIAEGCIGVGMGIAVIPKEMMEKKQWDKITEYVANAMKTIG